MEKLSLSGRNLSRQFVVLTSGRCPRMSAGLFYYPITLITLGVITSCYLPYTLLMVYFLSFFYPLTSNWFLSVLT